MLIQSIGSSNALTVNLTTNLIEFEAKTLPARKGFLFADIGGQLTGAGDITGVNVYGKLTAAGSYGLIGTYDLVEALVNGSSADTAAGFGNSTDGRMEEIPLFPFMAITWEGSNGNRRDFSFSLLCNND